MRRRVQILRNLALLSMFLWLVGSLSLWENTNTGAQQQPQPPDICPKDKPTVIVGSEEKLKNAVDDPDCKEIIVQGGRYEVNLAIFRDELIIKSLAGDRKRPILIGPSEHRQTITIAKSKNVTIQGLIIERGKGNIGILVSEQSEEIKLIDNIIHGYPEAGISIADSGVKEIRGNKIGGPFDIDEIQTQKNAVGIRIGRSIVENFTENEIKGNSKDGVELIESKVTLQGNTISQNTGCGVKADAKSKEKVTAPSDKNWIFDNKGGNTCPRELSRIIRKPEILVPSQFATLQEAIWDADPVRGAEDTPYVIRIQQGKDEYTESLCIDRSLRVQVQHPVRIRSSDSQKPAIAIGTQECPLNKEEKGRVDSEAGDMVPSIRIIMEASESLAISAPGNAGIQIGTVHQDHAQKTFLKVTLKDIIVENSKTGIAIRPTDKNHKLTAKILGTSPLQDADCTSAGYPTPTRERTKIQKNHVGIWLDNPSQADFSVQIEDVAVSNNDAAGIRYEGSGKSQLSVERARVTGNGTGLLVSSRSSDPNATDELSVFGRIWQNTTGGIQFNPDPIDPNARSQLRASLINVDIRENGSFGVRIQGNVVALLKASIDTPISQEPQSHNCEISDNFGPGVLIHGAASLTIENMFVGGNGYTDKGKTKAVPRSAGALKYGPDGIFASDSVTLSVKNTYVGPGNAGVGIALQASKTTDALKATLDNNYIDQNRKWGISYVIRSCLSEPTMPERFHGKVEGQDNTLVGNGFWLKREELAGGPDIGLGKGQVCPKDLEILILRAQQ